MKRTLKYATALGLVTAMALSGEAMAQQVEDPEAADQQGSESTGQQEQPETAQSGDEEFENMIVVTGIRKSLLDAANIKRNSSGVVEAITAEDIGKFPDTNLAESLQRITGVSIDRANNEGNQVTVRGFGPGFNMVTLNNRQMPSTSSLQSAGVSRSFNFREIASEGVSGLEVYKTGKANIVSGGIGATININTPKPFDYDEGDLVLFGAAKAIVDTSVVKGDDVTPEFSGLASYSLFDGALGLLVVGSYSERDFRKERVGTSNGWVRNRGTGVDVSGIDASLNPDRVFWMPWTVDNDVWDTERTRGNLQAVVQVRPFEELVITGDYTMSRFKEVTEMNRMSFWFDNPTGTADANGTVLNPSNAGDELNFWAWDFYFKTKNDSFGLNLDWQATDSLNISVDLHDSKSHSQPNGRASETLSNLLNPGKKVDIAADFSGEIPGVTFNDSALPGGAYDKANIASDLYQKRGYEMRNKIQQAQVNATWENLSDSVLKNIKFGAMYTEYNIDTYLSETFAFVNVPLDDLDIGFVPSDGLASGFDISGELFPLIPSYRVEDFLDIVRDQDLFFENPRVENGVKEETLAAYISFDMETEFNGMPFYLNAGVRYEDTDVDAYSVQEGLLALNYFHPEELRNVFDGIVAQQDLSGGYTRLLPNIDARMDVLDDVVFRASYSKTITRSDISAMFPSLNVRARPGGPFNASLGNPNLLPYESDNLDFSVEWYYDDISYVSVGYFKKWVENFIGAVVRPDEVLNVNGDPLTDPSVNPRPGCPDASATPNPACLSMPGDPVVTWDLATVENLDEAQVSGWEFNVQHNFGDSGFGVILNYTIVNTNRDYDVYNFSRIFALTGLSDSANAVAFYEKNGIQLRAAYNWRDDFLLSLGNEPTFTESYGQLDLSASYDITENFTIFGEAINITDETTRRYGRFREQLIDAEQYGPRFVFGVRAKY